MKINKKYRKKIEEAILEELRTSMDLEADPMSKPMWANILFMLRKFNKGNFFGTFQIKVLGTSIRDIRVVDRSYKMEDELSDFFDIEDFLTK